MPFASKPTSPYPVSGYDFVRAVMDQRGADAVETLLDIAHGGETDWLEKKAAVYVSAEKDPAFLAKLEKLKKCSADVVAQETRRYRLYAPYPKLLPLLGEPDVVDLLDNDPTAASERPFSFYSDAESVQKAIEKAERKRLKHIAEAKEEPLPVRDHEADMEFLARTLLDVPATNAPVK